MDEVNKPPFCNNGCIYCKSLYNNKDLFSLIRRKGDFVLLPCGIDISKSFFSILNRLNDKRIHLMTNGRMFYYKDFCDEVIKHNIQKFTVFLCGPNAKIHDKITRVKRSFRQTITGIRNLVELNQDVQVATVVCEENYKSLPEICSLVCNLNVTDLFFIFLAGHTLPLHKIMPYIIDCLKISNGKKIRINFNKHNREIGVISDQVFVGPKLVVFEIINKCNIQCLYCWTHSPLVKREDDSKYKKWLKEYLDYPFLKKQINTLVNEGVEIIEICAAGEPFLHPKIIDIIRYIKNKGIFLRINTNGTLLNKRIIDELLLLKLDKLKINISAGTGKMYEIMHPNQKSKVFADLKKNLTYLYKKKKELNTKYPIVQIINVITNENIKDIRDMIKFGIEVYADEINFRPVQITEHYTKKLFLKDEEINNFLKEKSNIKKLIKKSKIITNFGDFVKLICSEEKNSGLYFKNKYDKLFCSIGWYFCLIRSDKSLWFCCGNGAHIGNLKNKSFEGLWYSSRYTKYRLFAKKNKIMNVNVLCGTCPHFNTNLENFRVLKNLFIK